MLSLDIFCYSVLKDRRTHYDLVIPAGLCPVFFCDGDMVASWLVSLTPEQVFRVRALAGTLCCVLGQDTQPPKCINGYRKFNAGVNPAMD